MCTWGICEDLSPSACEALWGNLRAATNKAGMKDEPRSSKAINNNRKHPKTSKAGVQKQRFFYQRLNWLRWKKVPKRVVKWVVPSYFNFFKNQPLCGERTMSMSVNGTSSLALGFKGPTIGVEAAMLAKTASALDAMAPWQHSQFG